MIVRTDGYLNLEMSCPICGYARWTEEKIPNAEDVEAAKLIIATISDEEKEKVVELYHEERVPHIVRLKDKYPNKGKDIS